jgi:hypothetical protein
VEPLITISPTHSAVDAAPQRIRLIHVNTLICAWCVPGLRIIRAVRWACFPSRFEHAVPDKRLNSDVSCAR